MPVKVTPWNQSASTIFSRQPDQMEATRAGLTENKRECVCITVSRCKAPNRITQSFMSTFPCPCLTPPPPTPSPPTYPPTPLSSIAHLRPSDFASRAGPQTFNIPIIQSTVWTQRCSHRCPPPRPLCHSQGVWTLVVFGNRFPQGL